MACDSLFAFLAVWPALWFCTASCEQTQLLEGAAGSVALDAGVSDALERSDTEAAIDGDAADEEGTDAADDGDNGVPDADDGDADAADDAGPPVPEVLATHTGSVMSLAVDDTHLYWAGYDAGALGSVPKVGGSTIWLASESGLVVGVTVDTTRVYWTVGAYGAGGNGAVRSFLRDGGPGTPETLVSNAGSPWLLAHDETRVFWTDLNGLVSSIDKNGGAPTTLASGGLFPTSIGVDTDTVYWINHQDGAIMRVPKAGGTPSLVTLGAGPQSITGFALDDDRIYWLESSANGSRVRCIALPDGSVSEVATSAQTAYSIAVDATDVYWTVLAGGAVLRAAKQGGGANMIAAVLQQPTLTSGAITLDDTHLYWSSGDGTIFRMRKH